MSKKLDFEDTHVAGGSCSSDDDSSVEFTISPTAAATANNAQQQHQHYNHTATKANTSPSPAASSSPPELPELHHTMLPPITSTNIAKLECADCARHAAELASTKAALAESTKEAARLRRSLEDVRKENGDLTLKVAAVTQQLSTLAASATAAPTEKSSGGFFRRGSSPRNSERHVDPSTLDMVTVLAHNQDLAGKLTARTNEISKLRQEHDAYRETHATANGDVDKLRRMVAQIEAEKAALMMSAQLTRRSQHGSSRASSPGSTPRAQPETDYPTMSSQTKLTPAAAPTPDDVVKGLQRRIVELEEELAKAAAKRGTTTPRSSSAGGAETEALSLLRERDEEVMRMAVEIEGLYATLASKDEDIEALAQQVARLEDSSSYHEASALQREQDLHDVAALAEAAEARIKELEHELQSARVAAAAAATAALTEPRAQSPVGSASSSVVRERDLLQERLDEANMSLHELQDELTAAERSASAAEARARELENELQKAKAA
eukprot:PhM_4_TR14217/c0_g1_i2/m.41171